MARTPYMANSIGCKIDFTPPKSLFWDFTKIIKDLEKSDPNDLISIDINQFGKVDLTELYQDALKYDIPLQKINELINKFFSFFSRYPIQVFGYPKYNYKDKKDKKSLINDLYSLHIILSLSEEDNGLVRIHFYIRRINDLELDQVTQLTDVINELGLPYNIGGDIGQKKIGQKKIDRADELIRDDLNRDQDIL